MHRPLGPLTRFARPLRAAYPASGFPLFSGRIAPALGLAEEEP